jgi:Protein of unknown function (DUF2569)/GYF domain 2
MSELWYYAEDNEQHGPVSLPTLVEALSRIPAPEKVLVWNGGFDDWKAAEGVREIADQLVRPPPLNQRPPPLATREIRNVQSMVDDAAAVEAENNRGPKGLGGWLLLIAIAQVVAPWIFLANLVQRYIGADTQLFEQYPVALYGEAAIYAVLLALFLYATMLFFRRSRRFPRLFTVECVAMALTPMAITAWLGLGLSVATGRSFFEFAKFGPEISATAIAALIVATMLILYIFRSKRVANTFVR